VNAGQDRLGFVGLGRVGGPLARRLAAAGYEVTAFDPDADSRRQYAEAEAETTIAASAAEVASTAVCVFSCLPNPKAAVEMAEEHLVPRARSGQVYIDLGMMGLKETRRLHRLYAEKGAAFLDAPLSGGVDTDAPTERRFFVGGVEETFGRCRPLFEVLGTDGYIQYCGPGGSGQAVNFADQMAQVLGTAVCLEALALGHAAGVEIETIRLALAGGTGWRAHFAAVAAQAEQGEDGTQGENAEVQAGQLSLFLRAAEEYGLELPLTQSLDQFCRAGDETAKDGKGPSFWRLLGRRRGENLKARYLGHGQEKEGGGTA
jgi:3-hydroxyisobutyrate dehydrogenase-like beta-hydroxyacid dehydrogenase